MEWAGSMEVTVNNNTGGTITELSVSHQWGDYLDNPNPNPTASLTENASISFAAHTGSGGSDIWTLGFTDEYGHWLTRGNKQCDLEQEDYQSGKPVVINLYNDLTGFSIVPPVSSSCSDISYNP